MKQYKVFLLLVLSVLFCRLEAKTTNPTELLPLAVWISDDLENLPAGAIPVLENKLTQIAGKSGLTVSPDFSRFILTANINVLTKDITTSASPMHVYTLGVTFYIGDGIEGKSFASYSVNVKGVGENETKAYLSAIKNIVTSNSELQSFVNNGKTKIIAYYNSQCDVIIKKAQTIANMNRFDEAIWNLTSIPDVCTDCWEKAMNVTASIFQQKIDFECKEKINRATAVWSAGQNWEAAQKAGAILSTIDPNASCTGEIKTLTEKIAQQIHKVDDREWNFTYDYNIGLQRDMIKAYRDVGVAYGNGQTQNVTYKTLW